MFSDKNLDSYAIKIDEENDFKASTKNDTSYFEVTCRKKIQWRSSENISWEEILIRNGIISDNEIKKKRSILLCPRWWHVIFTD